MLMLWQAVIGPLVICRSICQLCQFVYLLSLLCQSVSLLHIPFRPISYMSVGVFQSCRPGCQSHRSNCWTCVQQLVVDLCGGQICVLHGSFIHLALCHSCDVMHVLCLKCSNFFKIMLWSKIPNIVNTM